MEIDLNIKNSLRVSSLSVSFLWAFAFAVKVYAAQLPAPYIYAPKKLSQKIAANTGNIPPDKAEKARLKCFFFPNSKRGLAGFSYIGTNGISEFTPLSSQKKGEIVKLYRRKINNRLLRKLKKFLNKCFKPAGKKLPKISHKNSNKRSDRRGANNKRTNKNITPPNRRNKNTDRYLNRTPTSQKERKCYDGLDNDRDGYTDFADKDCGEKVSLDKSIIWYHNWRGPEHALSALAGTPVTHIILSTVDLNEALEPDTGLTGYTRFNSYQDIVSYLAKRGKTPVWERDLFFQDGADSNNREETQNFAGEYSDCSVLTDPDYYAWVLSNIHREAKELGTQYTALDLEPYSKGREALMPCILSEDEAFFQQIREAVQEALSREGIKKVDYVYPSAVFGLNTAFEALSLLGKKKITESSYLNCQARLSWLVGRDVEVLGVRMTVNPQCHISSAYNGCQVADCGESNTALWSPEDLFENRKEFFEKRGTFIYSPRNMELPNALALQNYCLTNPDKCR